MVFFVDIDGIVYKNGKINKELIKAFNISKNKLVFCTGRGYVRAMEIIEKYVCDKDLIIIENGSKIVDNKGNKIYYKNISNLEKDAITKLNYEEIEYIIFNSNDSKYYTAFSKEKLKYVKNNYDSFKLFCKDLYESEMTQITIKFTNSNIKEKIFQKLILLGINVQKSEEYIIINAGGINKGKTINYYLNQFNINREQVVIIGNDYNDISMFDLDVKNKVLVNDEYTPEELIKKADYVTNYDDISKIIAKLI